MQVIQKIRHFLLILLSKEFLVFLFFLFISGIFWLLMSLNETFEKEVVIPLRMTNIPKNVVVINDISPTLKVTLRDKGYTIGGYLYGDILRPIIIDFTDYANGKGFGSVSMSDIQKQIYQQLYKSTKIVSIKPDKLDFYYNLGRHKRMPVKMTGQVIPANSYYLSKITYSPDSIDVYASKDLLDSIVDTLPSHDVDGVVFFGEQLVYEDVVHLEVFNLECVELIDCPDEFFLMLIVEGPEHIDEVHLLLNCTCDAVDGRSEP